MILILSSWRGQNGRLADRRQVMFACLYFLFTKRQLSSIAWGFPPAAFSEIPKQVLWEEVEKLICVPLFSTPPFRPALAGRPAFEKLDKLIRLVKHHYSGGQRRAVKIHIALSLRVRYELDSNTPHPHKKRIVVEFLIRSNKKKRFIRDPKRNKECRSPCTITVQGSLPIFNPQNSADPPVFGESAVKLSG